MVSATLLVLLAVSWTQAALQPNILLVVADDLGWGDAPWLDPSLPAPNIRQLARTGIVLNNSYVQQASCNKMILRLMVCDYCVLWNWHLVLQLESHPLNLKIKY